MQKPVKTVRPGVLATRAVNQYRRRDVLTYLGLRYYLANIGARADVWIRKVSTDLVLTRTAPSYFPAYHFKEPSTDGKSIYRPIHLPGPNEALAEAALLEECSRHPNAFYPSDCVFSYKPAEDADRSGVFEHYIAGLKRRHNAITSSCDDTPEGVVLYIDIKKFYPSIGHELASQAWNRQCQAAGMAGRYQELGHRLIDDHAMVCGENRSSILTGPMFSHLIGNLVLRELDEYFSFHLPVKYFRYVDDITLVGPKKAVEASRKIVKEKLAELELFLHEEDSPKNLEVGTAEWLEGRHDFEDSKREVSWMTFVGDLKRFLLQYPEKREELRHVLVSEGFRIPIQDYSDAIYEKGFLERVLELRKLRWFRNKLKNIDIGSLLAQAQTLRGRYLGEMQQLLEEEQHATGYGLKRLTPKKRYRAGRLVYLASEEQLSELAPELRSYKEMHFQACVMDCIVKHSVDPVISLGTNAAQAAAQPLRAADIDCSVNNELQTEAEQQGLAVFLLNGVRLSNLAEPINGYSDLLRFAKYGADLPLMKAGDPFMRELACLHGIAGSPRHPDLLDSAFDVDDEFALDAVDQIQQSISG